MHRSSAGGFRIHRWRLLGRSTVGGLALLILSGLLAGCSSGGGGSAGLPAIGLAFDASVASVTEGNSIAIPVDLELAGGIPLAGAVSVTVSASGGTASEGTDFTFTTQTLNFPMNAGVGTQRVATIDVPLDSRVEGTETITLTLTAMSGGAALGTIGTQTISVLDANSAIVRFQPGSSSTGTEATGFHSVSVQLDLAPGDTLDFTLPVQVVDSFEGTAQSGIDHQLVGTQVLSFPSGTPDGGFTSGGVTVLDDISPEADETISLSLMASDPAITVGSPATHILTINDDDFAGGGLIDVQISASSITSGATADLGSQPSASGPGSITTMTIRNIGTGVLQYQLPVLVSGDDYEFLVEFGSASSFPAALPAGPPPASPLIDVVDDIAEGVSFVVDAVALEAVETLPRFQLVDVGLPGGVRVDLDLERVEAPWTADALLSIDGAIAPFDPAWIDELSFWRGKVIGDPESRVFLSLSPRSSLGWIRHHALPGGIAYLMPEDIDPAQSGGVDARLVLSEQLPSTGKDLPGAYCTESLVPPPSAPAAAALPQAAPPTGSFTQGSVRLAIETDYQFFQRFGNLTDANTYITQMIAAISAVYTDQIHTPLSIAYVGLHSDPNDGWTIPDGPGSPGQLLDEFRAAWAPGLGGSWPVSADLAHFVSGASLGGGIAYIDVICNQNFAFGVSAVSGNIDWNTFTGSPSSGNWDFIVVGHELGHNFSALHSHDYCPPVDRCQSSCSGPASCEPGTLMSYCHLCGGISNITLEFSPKVANEMRIGVNGSCTADAVLVPGETATYELRFDPEGAAGSRTATLRIVHDGAASSPFDVVLDGTAQ